MNQDDTLSNVLYIDLNRNRFEVKDRSDLFKKYIGGTGVATRILLEECPEGCDPFAPENPVIFAVGALTGLFPLASKTVAMFKSPHTGDLGESHCGGRSAVAIRMAGLGAIVIKGKSTIPLYLSIHGHDVFFRNAETLWGMESAFTAGRIIRENETGAGFRSIMRIGKAGENLVTYSTVMAETYRHFGRLGLGAVFGSKNLKAVVVAGKNSVPIPDPKSYKKLYKEIYDTAVGSEVMKKYHDLGTPVNVMTLEGLGGLPTRNLLKANFSQAEQISGENFAENFLGRRIACAHCPVACIHIAALREPYEEEPYFYKTSMISYDYEPIFALGSMLEIGNPESFLKLMDKAEKIGIDAMSAGVVLAWATEAFEKGIITKKQTVEELHWGDHHGYIRVLDHIVDQPTEFYRDLAKGIRHTARKYGGEDFELTFGKNEMPGYHTGPAAHIGFSIGARHSHLDNAGYSIDQKKLMEQDAPPEEVVEELVAEEEWRQILSSIVICFFARGIYTPEITAQALASAGIEITEEGLKKLGREIHREKYKFKYREGFTFTNTHLPERIFETPSPVGRLKEEYIRKAIRHFEKIVNSN
jgi:aldehyde:ferredoxin oxidoreductase